VSVFGTLVTIHFKAVQKLKHGFNKIYGKDSDTQMKQVDASTGPQPIILRSITYDEPQGSSILDNDEPESKFSTITAEKTIGAKMYFEQYFDELFESRAGRMKRRKDFEHYLLNLRAPDAEKTRMRLTWLERERNYSRLRRGKLSVSQFDCIRPLNSKQERVSNSNKHNAHSSSRNSWIVREKMTDSIYVMRLMQKKSIVRKNLERRVRSERDFFNDAPVVSKYIVDLVYAFQDAENLYFISEHMPGGSLRCLMTDKGMMDEASARFYIAEMALCINEVHQTG
jgi:serine/threonine protein kinase